MTNQENQHPLTQAELREFTGDDIRYRHAFARSVIYTPGVKHLAERASAYWLLDDIAILTVSRELKRAAVKNPLVADMQFWILTVAQDQTALLTCGDGNKGHPVYSQRIPFTDFPLPSVEVWAAFDGQHWTLYLPSEH